MDLKSLREQFPILKREINGEQLIYFDNAATTQKPQAVIDAVDRFYTESNANIHRSFHTLGVESTKLWDDAHRKVAEFINAPSYENIVLTSGATHGVNMVANSLRRSKLLSEGDIIVLTDMEHHSNILPWQMLAEEVGAKIEWIPLTPKFGLDHELFSFLLQKYENKIKLVALSHLSNVLGVKNDVESICALGKEHGFMTLVDGAQSISKVKVDVQSIGCDFFVFSGHKVYGPTGTGALYIADTMLDKLVPADLGGEMIKSVWKTGFEPNDAPWKFEAGTPNIAGGVGLTAALEWFQANCDYDKLASHEDRLMKIAMAGLSGIKEVKVFGPTSIAQRAGIIAFSVQGLHPHDVATLMDESGIAIRAGYHCAEPLHRRYAMGPTARISFGVYNTEDEVRKFISVLQKAIVRFNG